MVLGGRLKKREKPAGGILVKICSTNYVCSVYVSYYEYCSFMFSVVAGVFLII